MISVSNTQFSNNEALLGGVANLENQANFNCYNCRFENNFGLRGSVLDITKDSKVNLTSCNFTRNIAFHGALYAENTWETLNFKDIIVESNAYKEEVRNNPDLEKARKTSNLT